MALKNILQIRNVKIFFIIIINTCFRNFYIYFLYPEIISKHSNRVWKVLFELESVVNKNIYFTCVRLHLVVTLNITTKQMFGLHQQKEVLRVLPVRRHLLL